VVQDDEETTSNDPRKGDDPMFKLILRYAVSMLTSLGFSGAN